MPWEIPSFITIYWYDFLLLTALSSTDYQYHALMHSYWASGVAILLVIYKFLTIKLYEVMSWRLRCMVWAIILLRRLSIALSSYRTMIWYHHTALSYHLVEAYERLYDFKQMPAAPLNMMRKYRDFSSQYEQMKYVCEKWQLPIYWLYAPFWVILIKICRRDETIMIYFIEYLAWRSGQAVSSSF